MNETDQPSSHESETTNINVIACMIVAAAKMVE